MCPGRDSNPHPLNGERILSPPRLPFRHLGRVEGHVRGAESVPDAACSALECLEATGGFEPPNRAFAELRLNHLATSPRTILPRFWCRGGDLNSYGFAPTAPSRPRVYQFHHLGTAPAWDLAGVGGLEPPTCGFGDRCSSQLSYTPALPPMEPAPTPDDCSRIRTETVDDCTPASSWFQPKYCATNPCEFKGG